MSAPVQASEPAETRQLATAASIEVQETLRRENAQLRTALATRIVIEQAKGMLAERFDIEFDEAFERLRREARSRRMKLHALAAAVTAREAWTGPIFQPGGPRNVAAGRSGAQRSRVSSPMIMGCKEKLGPPFTQVDAH